MKIRLHKKDKIQKKILQRRRSDEASYNYNCRRNGKLMKG